MAIVLEITQEGLEAENLSLLEGKMPALAYYQVDDGVAFDGYDGLSMLNAVYKGDILAKNAKTSRKNGSVYTELYIAIPADEDMFIRGVGIYLEDGTLYAYSRYSEISDGFPKSEGVNYTIILVIGRGNTVEFEFVYSPLDVDGMSREIEKTAKNNLDLYLEAYFLNILNMIVSRFRTQLEQQKTINKTEMK